MKSSTFLATFSSACMLLVGAASPLPALAAEVQSPVSAIPPSNSAQTDAQRKAFRPGDKSPAAVVNAFNQMAFFDHDPVGAMKKFLSEDFVERYPAFALDGFRNDKEAAIHLFTTRGWKADQPLKDVIYQIIADRNSAMVFHRVTNGPTDPGTAFVDIFRVKNGLIVEHWAVGQPVPANTTAKHSMF